MAESVEERFLGRGQVPLDFRYLNELGTEVLEIIDALGRCKSSQHRIVLCFDFDVLYSSVEQDKFATIDALDSEFWTGIALHLNGFDVVLLPGTLFEILNNLERRVSSLRRISSTNIGSALLKSFQEIGADPTRAHLDGPLYLELVQGFRRASIRSSDLYLFSMLKDRLRTITDPIPPPDRELFYRCAFELSRGGRTERILNNRVDAHNFATLYALNRDNSSNHRYILVSQSPAVMRLDNLLNSHEKLKPPQLKLSFAIDNPAGSMADKVVWSPRQAAILQMLVSAGQTYEMAEQLAWVLIESITYEKSIHARHERNRVAAQNDVQHDISNWKQNDFIPERKKVFLDLITDISKLNNAILDAGRAIDVSKITLDRGDQIKQFANMRQYIIDILKKNGYGDRLKETFPGKNLELRTYVIPDDNLFSYDLRAAIGSRAGPSKEIACMYYRFKGRHLFVFYGSASLDQFLTVFEVIKQSAVAKMAAGHLRDAALVDGSEVRFEILCGAGGELFKIADHSVNFAFNSEALGAQIGQAASEITFLRFDAPIMSASFEGDACAISSRYPLVDEFSFFAQELAARPFRGTSFEIHVRDLLNRSEGPA